MMTMAETLSGAMAAIRTERIAAIAIATWLLMLLLPDRRDYNTTIVRI